jgi:anaerobic magnesium-protoporphyrin IX monomethyl ester cyclase
MKILLLSPPYLPEYMRNARCDFVSISATQWYPILLGQAGAYLEAQGHEVRLIDAPAHYLDHDATRKIIREFQPELLVLYTGTKSEENDLAFADQTINELGCDAVIVGPFAGIDPEKTLKNSDKIDKLIVREFEFPLADLAKGTQLKEVNNLVYKQTDEIIHNPVRPNLTTQELDKIPYVSRFFKKQLDIYRYKTPSEPYPFIDIMTGRGCAWGHCTYCLWVNTYIKGQSYSTRSLGNVIGEIEYISRDLPEVRSVMIQDDTFTSERAMAFSEAKLAAGLNLPWSCYARADIDYDVLKAMKKAGCLNLHVGYESGSPKVLKRIKKGLTRERMIKFTDDAKRAGLRIHGDFAIGFPGETPQSAKKTIDFAYRLNPHTAQFQLMIPFPGTPFFSEMQKNGWLNANGQPDMPQFSNAQIRAMAKKAYRKFYLSPKYVLKSICHPYECVFGRLKAIRRAIPAMFWKRWHV